MAACGGKKRHLGFYCSTRRVPFLEAKSPNALATTTTPGLRAFLRMGRGGLLTDYLYCDHELSPGSLEFR